MSSATAGFDGCLKDKITPPAETQLSDNGKLLLYLEASGDYINSNEMPSLVTVDEVYSNMQNYLLVDIRSSTEFTAGHIDGAINKPHSELVSFLDSINYTNYNKIVIISNNGQSSAFYTCLLRLYGFENVFSMSYGMAYWNINFASEWLAARAQDNNILSTFNMELVPKPEYSPLPDIALEGNSLSESVKHRIINLMGLDFEDNFTESSGTATIDFSYLADSQNNYFIVCYNSGPLYRNYIQGISHPDGAVLYIPPPPPSDLSSSTYLQTLLSKGKIAFYSTDGQLSAFAAAYLRVLGYDAKSVLFGANNMFYTIMLGVEGLNEEAFTESKIRNYPYVTGD